MPKNNRFILLSLILFIGAFLRLIFLDRFPTGISNDEIHFILNSKSVFYQFSDLSGRWFPLSFTTIPNESSSEIIFPLLSLILGPLPTNLFTARLPFALVGIITILLIYLFTYRLSKNFYLAIISALVASLNPWSIYVNRTSFDAPVALMFYMICFYLMTSKNIKWLLCSSIFGILGFYSYIGTKVIYFPFILISSIFFYRYYHKKKFLKIYLILIFISLFVTAIYIFSLSKQNSYQRTQELWTPLSPKINAQVKIEKIQSLQSPVKLLFTNNYVVYIKNFIDKYLYSYSTDILFIKGDHTFMVSLWKHGYFYYIDFILIIFGLIYLYKYYSSLLFILILLISLSPIPEAIRSDTIPAYAFHSCFQYPFVYILIASGIIFLFRFIHLRYFRILFFLIYIIGVLNFIDIYFFKYPIYQPEGFNFSRRIISKFLSFENQKNDIFFLTPEPDTLFRTYLFYTNLYNLKTTKQVKKIYSNSRDNIIFDKIHFIKDPKLLPEEQNYTLIVDANLSYPKQEGNSLSIKKLYDSFEIFKIFRSTTCFGFNLDYFSHNLNFMDLKVEQMNEKEFCAKYLSLPN